MKKTYALSTIALSLILSGCTLHTQKSRLETASRIAQSKHMQQSTLNAAPFSLTLWTKAAMPNAPVTIYIEGDGDAWITPYRPATNPTPKNPIALRLAAIDQARNVIYIARPCQYSGTINGVPCPQEYWTYKRFSTEVITAYTSALNQIMTKHRFNGIHLVGYSGGAAIAALIGKGRTDLLSLRSIAGNLHNKAFTDLHDVSAMPQSLDPIHAAQHLSHIPQLHFIGTQDKTTPLQIAQSWKQEAPSPCVQLIKVTAQNHIDGWEENWARLSQQRPTCSR